MYERDPAHGKVILMARGGDISGGGSTVLVSGERRFVDLLNLSTVIQSRCSSEANIGELATSEGPVSADLKGWTDEEVAKGRNVSLSQLDDAATSSLKQKLKLWTSNSPIVTGLIDRSIRQGIWNLTVLEFRNAGDVDFGISSSGQCKNSGDIAKVLNLKAASGVMRDRGIFLVQSIWNQLKRLDRAALIAHEALRYQQVNFSDLIASGTIQNIVRKLMTELPGKSSESLDSLLLSDFTTVPDWMKRDFKHSKLVKLQMCSQVEKVSLSIHSALSQLPLAKKDESMELKSLNLKGALVKLEEVEGLFLSNTDETKIEKAAKKLQSLAEVSKLIRSKEDLSIFKGSNVSSALESHDKFHNLETWLPLYRHWAELAGQACQKSSEPEIQFEFVALSSALLRLSVILTPSPAEAYFYQNFTDPREGYSESDLKRIRSVFDSAAEVILCDFENGLTVRLWGTQKPLAIPKNCRRAHQTSK